MNDIVKIGQDLYCLSWSCGIKPGKINLQDLLHFNSLSINIINLNRIDDGLLKKDLYDHCMKSVEVSYYDYERVKQIRDKNLLHGYEWLIYDNLDKPDEIILKMIHNKQLEILKQTCLIESIKNEPIDVDKIIRELGDEYGK